MTDYYEILGIPRDASEADVKKAFRTLAKKLHPDQGGSEEDFKKINEAYAVLSDPIKRQQYDSPSPQFSHNMHGFEFHSDNFQEFMNHEMFREIFGFSRRRAANQNIQFQTIISLEEAFSGKEIVANITLPSGKEQTVNIKIPPGISQNTTLRLSGMGDNSISELPPGDLLLTVHIEEHPRFKRSGDDLIEDIEINCIDAMLGEVITVTSIDQRQLQTKIPAGIQHDSVRSLDGYGMPKVDSPNIRGRHLIRIKIKIPLLSDAQKKQLHQLNLKNK